MNEEQISQIDNITPFNPTDSYEWITHASSLIVILWYSEPYKQKTPVLLQNFDWIVQMATRCSKYDG